MISKSILKVLSLLLVVAGLAVACEKDVIEEENNDLKPKMDVIDSFHGEGNYLLYICDLQRYGKENSLLFKSVLNYQKYYLFFLE